MCIRDRPKPDGINIPVNNSITVIIVGIIFIVGSAIFADEFIFNE